MDDLALFDPNLLPEEQFVHELVEDDEVPTPQELVPKRTDGVQIVGRIGFPTVAVQPIPACLYCGKVGATRQCKAPGCARHFHHFCVIDAKGEDDDHNFCDKH